MRRFPGPNRLKTPEYKAWEKMRARCRNPKEPGFDSYGGRGISICKQWESFEVFLEDLGIRPSSEYSLDRINVNGNYSPENCRWATRKEQNNNKRNNHRVQLGDKIFTLQQVAELVGINHKVVRNRIRRGWSYEEALIK